MGCADERGCLALQHSDAKRLDPVRDDALRSGADHTTRAHPVFRLFIGGSRDWVINLGFENSLGFAAFLRSASRPFVFASGYGEQEVLGESRVSELMVAKPYDLESLSDAITRTLARS
jgi:hypothetical protein